MPILVTGADGFIGRHLMCRLINDGHNIIAGTRSVREPRDGDQITNVSFDLLDEKSWKPIIEHSQNVEAIVHLASLMPGNEFAASDYKIANIEFSEKLLCGFRNRTVNSGHSCAPFLYFSSIGVVGNSPVLDANGSVHSATPAHQDLEPYFASKRDAEKVLKSYAGSPVKPLIFRLTSPYGLGMPDNIVLPSFVQKADDGKALHWYGSGNRTQDFILVDDVVEICVRAIEYQTQDCSAKMYCLASGESTSMRDLAKLVADHYSVPVGPAEKSDPQEHKVWRVDNSSLLQTFHISTMTSLSTGLKQYINGFGNKKQMRSLKWWKD